MPPEVIATMDQLIARAAFLGSPEQFLAALPHSQPALVAALLILFIWTAILAIAMWRSSRRQRRIAGELKEIRAEVDRLHRSDERRRLIELRSNQRFLDEITLEPGIMAAQENSRENKIHAAQPKTAEAGTSELRDINFSANALPQSGRDLETTNLKRVLVTGGSGFLGSHLCERLIAQGSNVICVDNFFSSARSNIEHLIGHKRFELIRHDVTFPLYAEVDQIYNLACPASPIHYQRDPVQTTKTSVHGAINMLGLAKRVRASILQASTSEVYGDPNVHPQTEDYWGHVNPIGPRSCYDEGKRCAETLFFDYRRQHNMPIKVMRIFNTYGPRMHPNDGRVVSNFVIQALLGQDITIYGDGSQTRSFCYVDDLIDGMVRLMATPDSVTGPINIGNPTEFTILELAAQVIRLTGSRSKIVHRPRPQDDPRQRRPDISMAQSVLEWSPRTPLELGLEKTISYFEQLLQTQGRTTAAYA